MHNFICFKLSPLHILLAVPEFITSPLPSQPSVLAEDSFLQRTLPRSRYLC